MYHRSMDGAGDFRQFCADQRWFQAIDFGDVVSSGRFPTGTPQNRTLFGVMELLMAMDLDGARVLDIGTTDGLIAFALKSLGAGEVVAVDSYDRETFRRGRDELGLDIEYRPNVQIKDLLGLFAPGSFDLIVCAGVIYHMLNPFSAFITCRKLVRNHGWVFVESAIRPGDEPVLMLNSEMSSPLKEMYTYWVPTPAAMAGMSRLVSMQPRATRLLAQGNGPPFRGTVLAQAVNPAEVVEPSEMLARIHEVDFCDFEFQVKVLPADAARSAVTIGDVPTTRTIDVFSQIVEFPYHPRDQYGVGRVDPLGPDGRQLLTLFSTSSTRL